MTVRKIFSAAKRVWEFPICGADKMLQIIFSEKNFFGAVGKQVRSVFAVKVADFAQNWNGVEIPF